MATVMKNLILAIDVDDNWKRKKSSAQYYIFSIKPSNLVDT